jgi:hypothetical protein
MTHKFHGIQKQKFSVTCHGVLFMETPLGPLEHDK